MIDTWSSEVRTIIETVWARVADFVPNILGATLILLVGAVVAFVVSFLVTKLLKAIKIQSFAEQIKLTDLLKKAKIRTDIAEISGVFLRWVIIFIFIIPAANVLKVIGVAEFFESVLLFIPRVLAVAVLVVFGWQLADALSRLVRTACEAIGTTIAKLVENLVRSTILSSVVITSMFALGVPQEFTVIIFIAVASALALGFGLSFGLGAQDHMNDLVKRIRSELKG